MAAQIASVEGRLQLFENVLPDNFSRNLLGLSIWN